MLRDSDIDSLNGHLASFSLEQQKQHEKLQDLLGQFKSLLDDYSSLKSDYEEVKDGREKYKRQARGQVSWGQQAAKGHPSNKPPGPQSICSRSC